MLCSVAGICTRGVRCAKATKALQKTLEWRQEYRPDLITWEEVQGCAFRLTLHMFAAQCCGLYVVALHLSVCTCLYKEQLSCGDVNT